MIYQQIIDFLPKLSQYCGYIIQGLPLTLMYTVLSLAIGFCIAIVLAIISFKSNNIILRILRPFARFYVSVFRGTPMIVQILLIYQGLPLVSGWTMTPFTAGVMALSLNSGAYVSEVIRSGIQSIDKGQFDAAEALHIPRYLVWKDIILPQAFRNILPALFNEGITLLKDTSLLSYIGVYDILRRATAIGEETFDYLTPLLLASIIYYILVFIISNVAKKIERKLESRY